MCIFFREKSVFSARYFAVLPMLHAITAIVIMIIGLVLICTGVGISRLRQWGWSLGPIVSIFLAAIAVLTLDFTSFEFIRGVIVVACLLAFRRYFSQRNVSKERTR